MGLSKSLLWMAGIAVITAILCNSPFDIFIPTPLPATLQHLADTELEDLHSHKFKAVDLWKNTGAVIMVVRRPGCLLCREEALELSKLHSELKLRNIPLYAVVHEQLGVPEFSPFFKGNIYLDRERRFYGPRERWMFLSGFLRTSVWSNILRAWKKGISGNLEGEGRLLGGVFVVGPADQGILFEHREKEFGDHANVSDILTAIRQIAAPSTV